MFSLRKIPFNISMNGFSLIRIVLLLMLLITTADFVAMTLSNATRLEIVPQVATFCFIFLIIWPFISLYFSEKLLKPSIVFGLIVGFIIGILPSYFFESYYQSSIDSISIKRNSNLKWSDTIIRSENLKFPFIEELHSDSETIIFKKDESNKKLLLDLIKEKGLTVLRE